MIGLIGTAPGADAVKFPLDKPIRILRPSDAVGLGADGTLPDAIDSIFDQAGCPIVLVRVEEGVTMPATWANAIGSPVSFSGVHAFRRASSDGLYKPKLLLAPGLTQAAPADGVASITVTAPGGGYQPDKVTVTIGGTGSGAQARAVVGDGGAIASDPRHQAWLWIHGGAPGDDQRQRVRHGGRGNRQPRRNHEPGGRRADGRRRDIEGHRLCRRPGHDRPGGGPVSRPHQFGAHLRLRSQGA